MVAVHNSIFQTFNWRISRGTKLFYINNPPEGGIAQLVERLLCKQDVIGSNPVTSTNLVLE